MQMIGRETDAKLGVAIRDSVSARPNTTKYFDITVVSIFRGFL